VKIKPIWVVTPGKQTNNPILFIITIGGILVLFMYITRLASNEIFSPSNNYIGK
jgi:high-affinity K+ transport system ATPase subunit B